jgi:hypothetical protein
MTTKIIFGMITFIYLFILVIPDPSISIQYDGEK